MPSCAVTSLEPQPPFKIKIKINVKIKIKINILTSLDPQALTHRRPVNRGLGVGEVDRMGSRASLWER